MSVADRDLFWTEWVRRNSVISYRHDQQLDIFGAVHILEQRWKDLILQSVQLGVPGLGRMQQGVLVPVDGLKRMAVLSLLF